MKFSESLQKILPFGYLILVVLGIMKESIFYYFLGVNILKYSTVMDILISPISDLSSHPVILFGFIAYTLCIYFWFSWITKNRHEKILKGVLGTKKNFDEMSEEDIKNHFGDAFISVFTVCLFSFFVGVGFGNGSALHSKIQKNKLKHDCILTFNTGESKAIYLVGTNSINCFYFEKGNKHISISPIGAIKKVEIVGNTQKSDKGASKNTP